MPDTPNNFKAYGINGAVHLSWDADLSLDGYYLYSAASLSGSYSKVTGLPGMAVDGLIEDDHFDWSGLTNGQSKYLRVTASLDGEESSPTTAKKVTPHKPAVGVVVSGASAGGLTSGLFTVTAKDSGGSTTKFYPSEDAQSGNAEAITLGIVGGTGATFSPTSPLVPDDGSETVTFRVTLDTVGAKTLTVGFPAMVTLQVSYAASHAIIISIADAIVTALNSQTWFYSFSAERRILPVEKLEDLQTLKVPVIPGGASWELLNRGSAGIDDYVIDVGFQLHLGTDSSAPDFEAEVPSLILLVQQVATYLKSNRKMYEAVLVTAELPALYDTQALREQNTFVSVCRLTYKRAA